MKIKCRECNQEKGDYDFYKIITQSLKYSEEEYEDWIVCKDCVIATYFSYSKGDFYKTLNDFCKHYNLYYDIGLVKSIYDNNIKDEKYLLNQYIRNIASLFQYKNKKYKDSVFKSEIVSMIGNYSDILIPIEDKSDIDFINDDIKELKIKISKALQKEDFNAHNKWMNSLRDALELRDKLQGNNDCTINIGTIMVKDDTDINKLSEELSILAKRKANLS